MTRYDFEIIFKSGTRYDTGIVTNEDFSLADPIIRIKHLSGVLFIDMSDVSLIKYKAS